MTSWALPYFNTFLGFKFQKGGGGEAGNSQTCPQLCLSTGLHGTSLSQEVVPKFSFLGEGTLTRPGREWQTSPGRDQVKGWVPVLYQQHFAKDICHQRAPECSQDLKTWIWTGLEASGNNQMRDLLFDFSVGFYSFSILFIIPLILY